MDRFEPHKNMYSVIIFGRRGTGKTTLVKDLLEHFDCPNVTVIDTKDSGEYNDAKCTHHNEYSENVLDKLIEKQRKIKLSQHACIVFDNCMVDNDWTKHKGINMLVFNCRCMRIKHIMTINHPTNIPRRILQTVDYVFIFPDSSVSIRKQLYEYYGDMFPSFDEFNNALDSCAAEKHSCMVIDHTKQHSRVFVYKANVKN